MNYELKCPVCNKKLIQYENALKCVNNHSFDIAKQGYVNLFITQTSSKKRHGDDSLMVIARRDFLDKGYYDCLCNKLIEVFSEFAHKDMTVIDLGCGECWYTAKIEDYCIQHELNTKICAMDISKKALIAGSKRSKNLNFVVGSISDVPVMDSSIDMVINLFAPCSDSEVKRILKPDGICIRVFPLERHLMGLKSKIYEEPYLNKVDISLPEGFCQRSYFELKTEIHIDNSMDIMNLFMMTPYYYKTGNEDQMKIKNLSELTTEIEFGILAYSPK